MITHQRQMIASTPLNRIRDRRTTHHEPAIQNTRQVFERSELLCECLLVLGGDVWLELEQHCLWLIHTFGLIERTNRCEREPFCFT